MQMCLKFNVELAFSVVENEAEREVPACGWAVTVKYAAVGKVRFFSKSGQIRPFALCVFHRPELILSSTTLEK